MKALLNQLTQHRSSAYPWTFIESMLAGYRSRSTYNDVQAFVIFIGQPRSGTSLVGSLLNAHRHVWIAQELNALRYVARGYGRNQLYWLLQMRDRAFGDSGRRWTGYDYEIPGQWQGRCQELRVIGDKKAGLSSELLGRQPELLIRLQQLVRVPIKIIQVIRNPFNVIATIHRKRRRTSLPLAIEMYFRRCETNWSLMRDPTLSIRSFRLEDLIDSPHAELAELCRFLGVTADGDYLNAARQKLFDKPRQSQAAITWPAMLVDRVSRRAAEFPFLTGYEFSETRTQSAA